MSGVGKKRATGKKRAAEGRLDRDELESTTDVGVASYPTQPQRKEKDEAHSLRAAPAEAIDNNVAGFNVFDLNAYPPYTTELDACVQERLNSLGPVWSEDAQEDFQLFARAWQNVTERAAKRNQDWSTCDKKSMMGNFNIVLGLRPASIEQRADEFLGKMLNNNKFPPRMELVGRDTAMAALASFCMSHLGKAKSGKSLKHPPKPPGQEEAGASSEKEVTSGSIIYAASNPDKPGLMTLFSTRGSGKTQLLKRVLFGVAGEQLAGGYVLVCECSKIRHNLPFGAELAKLNRSGLHAEDIERFIVSIIARHVRERGLVFSPDGELSARDAYRVWQEACGGKHLPLIVFDTVEDLPQMTQIPRSSGDRTRTILEAFAAHLPGIHGMVGCGSLHINTSLVNDVTNGVVWSLPPLKTFLPEEYAKAVSIWSSKEYGEVTCTMRILHRLCGGVPRLLIFSTYSMDVPYVNYLESWGCVINRCIDECNAYVLLTSVGNNDRETNTMYALAALASGTRTFVRPEDPVPLTPVTWSVPQQGILYNDPDGRAMMPPALFLKGDAHAISEDLATAKNPNLYSDELVRSWPKGLSLHMMHCPITLAELQGLTVDKLKATSRGKPWEHQVAHCIVGRWYCLSLKEWQLKRSESRTPPTDTSGGGKAKLLAKEEIEMQKKTFTLYEVMYGGAAPVKGAAGKEVKPVACSAEVERMLEGITVNFSDGVSKMNCKEDPKEGPKCFYLNTDANGHHDAKFRAKRGDEWIVVCVQLRHGNSKTNPEIKKQLFKKPQTSKMLDQEPEVAEADLVDLLLVIESGPPGLDKELVAFGPKSKLNNRAIRIDGSYFAPASVLSVLDPAYALRNNDTQIVAQVTSASPQATVPPSST